MKPNPGKVNGSVTQLRCSRSDKKEKRLDGENERRPTFEGLGDESFSLPTGSQETGTTGDMI